MIYKHFLVLIPTLFYSFLSLSQGNLSCGNKYYSARFFESVASKQTQLPTYKRYDIYLSGLLNFINPESKNIILLKDDPSYNAFATYHKEVAINIGLFADIPSEVALSFVVGHEMSHITNNDIENSFCTHLENANKSFVITINAYQQNQDLELRADKDGFHVIEKIDPNGAMEALNFLNNDADLELKKAGKANLSEIELKKLSFSSNLMSTHPVSRDRIKEIKSISSTSNSKLSFNQKEFAALQREARKEKVKLVFDNLDYKKALEDAFLYYIVDGDDFYIYFILESIRRRLVLKPDLLKTGFLAEDIKSIDFKNEEGIMQDLSYLTLNSTFLNTIKASNPTFPIKTYEDAFNYFEAIAISKKLTNCYMSIGVFKNNKDLLELYLASNTLNSHFVKNISVITNEGSNQEVILDEFILFDRKKRGNFVNHEKTNKWKQRLTKKIPLESKNSVPLSNNISAKIQQIPDGMSGKDLKLYSPELWEEMNKNNITHLTAVNTIISDDLTSIKTTALCCILLAPFFIPLNILCISDYRYQNEISAKTITTCEKEVSKSYSRRINHRLKSAKFSKIVKTYSKAKTTRYINFH